MLWCCGIEGFNLLPYSWCGHYLLSVLNTNDINKTFWILGGQHWNYSQS
jgi:hypothetical protein